MTGYRTGLRAETLAAWFLRCKGYRVLARRYKTPVGEIDLIAARAGVIVFVEVKARGSLDMALSSIRPRQAQRIVRAAAYYMAGYMSGHKGQSFDMRFDVIAVHPPFRVKHIRAAFSA
jgi:putative endonuclease